MKFGTRQLVTLAVFGALWGIVEISLGSILHAAHLPFDGVILASGGYPASYPKGLPISGLDGARNDDTIVFHAGTTRNDAGEIVTNGGRVLTVVGLGDSIADARAHAYTAADCITFEGAQRREDIASREA